MANLAGGQGVAGSIPVSPTDSCRSEAVSEKSGAVFFVCVPRECHYSFLIGSTAALSVVQERSPRSANRHRIGEWSWADEGT